MSQEVAHLKSNEDILSMQVNTRTHALYMYTHACMHVCAYTHAVCVNARLSLTHTHKLILRSRHTKKTLSRREETEKEPTKRFSSRKKNWIT